MKVMIHACPPRMWYVERFLAPSLEAQGLEPIIWNDSEGFGCLASCVRSFLSGQAEWHIQDDVLICRDFAEKIKRYDFGVVSGFCHSRHGDDKSCVGRVYAEDLWHGFPCVRIPVDVAREFCSWIDNADHDSEQAYAIRSNLGDDFLFREFFLEKHGTEMVTNISLVEHVDWLIGGSQVSSWRGYVCRSDLWDDEDLVEDLKKKIKTMN